MQIHSSAVRIRRRAGFTLLEMVIVLGIIAMIMGGAIFAMRGISSQTKPTQAKADINGLLSALEAYRLNHPYPSTQEGLKRLVDARAMQKIPLDPWGNEYLYKLENGQPIIISRGEDGMENTDDDINSQTMGIK